MYNLSKNKKSYKKIHDLFINSIKAKLVLEGIDLKIFDHLNEPLTYEEICKKLDLNKLNTKHFLNSLAMIDIIKKKDNRYFNTKDTDLFLVSNSSEYIGSLISQIWEMSISPLDNLKSLIKDGPLKEKHDFSSPEIWQKAVKTSSQWVSSGFGYEIAKKLSSLKGFKNFKNMLDLGGGHGLFGLYIISENENMECKVFDQPKVTPVTKEFIKEYKMEKRISTISGDYMNDDLLGPYDLIFASCTLNFAKYKMDEMIKKIFDSVKPQGYFVSLHDGSNKDHTKPDTMLSHLASMMTSGDEFFLEKDFISDAMIKAGFRQVRSKTINTPMGELEFDIGYK